MRRHPVGDGTQSNTEVYDDNPPLLFVFPTLAASLVALGRSKRELQMRPPLFLFHPLFSEKFLYDPEVEHGENLVPYETAQANGDLRKILVSPNLFIDRFVPTCSALFAGRTRSRSPRSPCPTHAAPQLLVRASVTL